jgi:hypothetical protein
MNRRDLNRIMMIGTALAGGWPAWLRRAFGAESGQACPLPTGQEGELRWRRIVAAAYRRGQQAGKPLLAFVVPAIEDDASAGYDKLWLRGRAFGELLNHGDDEALATLALAEIVCAPMSALRTLAPSLAAGEPLMVLLETDGVPARARALHAELPRDSGRGALVGHPANVQDWDAYFDQQRLAEDSVVQSRIAVLSRLLHEGLRATPQMLLARAAQAQAKLAAGQSGALTLPDDAGPAQLHRLSALLLASAVGLPERQRQPAIQRIADAARFVLCRRRVPGSRWSNSSGCGTDPELEPSEKEAQDGALMISCGMGHVPEKSRRFLDFLGRDATWRRPS